eukprot:1127385-Alexandrium_andersonii.AAC.1
MLVGRFTDESDNQSGLILRAGCAGHVVSRCSIDPSCQQGFLVWLRPASRAGRLVRGSLPRSLCLVHVTAGASGTASLAGPGSP